MSRDKVLLRKTAEKELSNLPVPAIVRIIAALRLLEDEPRPPGCKKLKGYQNLWRVRVGNYRILYSIEDVILLVDVRAIGDRKDIYE